MHMGWLGVDMKVGGSAYEEKRAAQPEPHGPTIGGFAAFSHRDQRPILLLPRSSHRSTPLVAQQQALVPACSPVHIYHLSLDPSPFFVHPSSLYITPNAN